jgi:hypothetical protein
MVQANKMVATERIKLAEADEELRSTVEEKEALKSALKLIESENDRLRQSVLLEKADVFSDQNSERTLLSPRREDALGEGKSIEPEGSGSLANMEQENSNNARRSIMNNSTNPMETTGPLELVEESESVREIVSEETVTALSITEPSTSSPQITPTIQTKALKPSGVENPWSTLYRHDSNHGIMTYMG